MNADWGNAPAPAARELLLRLLVRRQEQTIEAADAVRACALFSISTNNARVALNRLLSSGLLETVGRGTYTLGPAGQALGREVAAWREAEARLRPWDGSWVMVSTTALGRTDRKALRGRERTLALLGFRSLDEGLSIRPDNFKGGVGEIRERLHALGLEVEAPVFVASDLDPRLEEHARTLWVTDRLEDHYASTRAELERSLARLAILPIEEAARESYLLGDQAVRQLVFDPLLPDPLVSSVQRQAFVETLKRYDAAGFDVWQRFLG